MKTLVMTALVAGLCFQLASGNAHGQASPPVSCPTNYQCSLILTGTLPLVGSPTDGEPHSIIGFLNFDSAGAITGVVSINSNGTTVTNYPVSGATCVPGTSSTLGALEIPITTSSLSTTLVFDFVTYVTSSSIDLLLSGETSTSPADTPVSVGVCRASAAG